MVLKKVKFQISLVKFTDIFINKNNFIRNIENKKFWFENGKQILFSKEMKSKFISKISSIKNLTNNFITLDIETFIKNNIMIVCCISIFDGKNKLSYFL
jgi:hypothetical protein